MTMWLVILKAENEEVKAVISDLKALSSDYEFGLYPKDSATRGSSEGSAKLPGSPEDSAQSFSIGK